MTEKRKLKDAIYGQLARITKALSSEKRIEILDLLSQRAWTVDELARETDMSLANASRHLGILRAARLLDAEKKGLFVEYSVSNHAISAVLGHLRTFAEAQLPEIDRLITQYAAGRQEFAPIDRETLLRRVHDGSALLLDVRPDAEYRAGHLRGAVSIPVDQLVRRLPELPRNRQIVAYCRGPWCLFASNAVRLLRRRGFDAVRYDEGVIEWRTHGLPVTTGDDVLRARKSSAKRAN
jgi:rhodanese-related sulfurtransferase